MNDDGVNIINTMEFLFLQLASFLHLRSFLHLGNYTNAHTHTPTHLPEKNTIKFATSSLLKVKKKKKSKTIICLANSCNHETNFNVMIRNIFSVGPW